MPTADMVRTILLLNNPDTDPGSTSRFSDDTINGNIRAGIPLLETMTKRVWIDQPAVTKTFTTQGRAQLYIPGIRNVTQVLWQGAPISFGVPPSNVGACWFLPDVRQSGIYTAIQMRVFQAQGSRGSNWLSNPQWFDQGADSPYAPWNRGGGDSFNSLPNDLAITGDWGYADGDPELGPFYLALKFYAAFLTLRPPSILADVILSPSGQVTKTADLPPEVDRFVSEFAIGEQAVSI
jgi:hypothetical protein